MIDKVQKIREEVVRMHNLLPVMDGDNISVNYADRICTTLEMYIDSLQEEPVSEELEKAHIWKSANGDDLPEIDREVVAFQETFPTDVDAPSLFKIVIAHRPNPKGYDGKSVTTGKVEHYTPKTYDKGGWNIPNVVLWLDLNIPNLEED